MKMQLPALALLLTLSLVGTLWADDDRPVVDASTLKNEQADNSALPSLYLVGDSTVRIGSSKSNMIGWGERIAPFFDLEKINVVNKAIGGRSTRTYYTEGRWESVENQLKKGDFIIIQFGHNDVGRVGDPSNKHRASADGYGSKTEQDKHEDGTIEEVHSFGWYMTQFIKGAKKKGAIVIICSPIPHKNSWENGRDFEDIARWDKKVARKNGAHFIDLTMIITDAYKEIGKDKVETFFADRGTHTNEEGATFNAKCVIAGLKSLRFNPFRKYFSKEGAAIEPYDD